MSTVKTFGILFFLCLSTSLVQAQETTSIADAVVRFVFTSNDTSGSISGFKSSSTIDLKTPENSVFQGSVKTETIKTGNFLRDWSLKSGKYFDADTYPIISFKSSLVTATDKGYMVSGDVTIKKTTKAIKIRFVQNGKTLTGTTSLYASDFGINVKKKREDNKVAVTFEMTLK